MTLFKLQMYVIYRTNGQIGPSILYYYLPLIDAVDPLYKRTYEISIRHRLSVI